MTTPGARRILIAIPAYNEQATIAEVVRRVERELPGYDLVVVNDGSPDATGSILAAAGTTTLTHLANLGYGRAIQTAIRYARARGYEALITLDADGQHDPATIPPMIDRFFGEGWHVLVGSRYVQTRRYDGAPLSRRIGMQLFSSIVGALGGRRIYDTTSGLKVMHADVFEPLTRFHFVDFHAEAIVYLMRLGYTIGEHPVHMAPRLHGTSMYSALSALKYPTKTLLMVVLGIVEAWITARARKAS